MKPELLVELTNRHFNPTRTITESLNSGGNVFVEGILATVEQKNGNGRYYPRALWEREVAQFEQKIKHNTTETCGELDHPDSPIINMQNSSHCIRKIWWNGDKVMGTIEIFSDPGVKGTNTGRIAGAMIHNGLTIGISSRGMGSLKETGGILEVQDDFELLTWDLVSNPSNHNSWMDQKSSLNEGLNPQNVNPYNNVQSIITDILCSNGNCPIF
jgi:hypothetical protein